MEEMDKVEKAYLITFSLLAVTILFFASRRID